MKGPGNKRLRTKVGYRHAESLVHNAKPAIILLCSWLTLSLVFGLHPLLAVQTHAMHVHSTAIAITCTSRLAEGLRESKMWHIFTLHRGAPML